uniref:EGF-like domain-containing protein n=1 Tax=Panagrolaimus sp. JU765 TaxID=591449 RepID=A0AC34QCN5_9BILA
MSVKSQVGLYLNFTVSNFVAYGNGQLTIQPDHQTNISVTGNGQYNGIHQTFIEIVAQHQLMFTLSYVALDVCKQPVFDCVHGTCSANRNTNNPQCTCQGCYSPDPKTGKCTIETNDGCQTGGNTACGDSKYCVPTAYDCSYYCNCPNGLPGCTTNMFCAGLENNTCMSASKFSKDDFAKLDV